MGPFHGMSGSSPNVMLTNTNSWLSWLGTVCLMVIVGALCGLLVGWIEKPAELQAWIDAGAPLWPMKLSTSPWEPMFYGVLYSVSMWSTMLGVRGWAYRRFPVLTWRAMMVHVVANTLMLVGVFVGLMALDPYICLWITHAPYGDTPHLGTKAIVSFGVAGLLTSLTYAVDFYRAMQKAEHTALVAELRALRAQINPHFLFNTLNSIAALIHTRPNEAEYVIEELAELFRYTLQASKHPTVSLGEELRATDRYIVIEKTRFRDHLVIIRDIDQTLLDAHVPSLLIQPLVENAVKHGVSRSEDPCAIYLEIQRVGTEIVLRVRDTGPGFGRRDPASIYKAGTGLANVRDRLQLHFGLQARLEILSDGVELHFPYVLPGDRRTEPMVALPSRAEV